MRVPALRHRIDPYLSTCRRKTSCEADDLRIYGGFLVKDIGKLLGVTKSTREIVRDYFKNGRQSHFKMRGSRLTVVPVHLDGTMDLAKVGIVGSYTVVRFKLGTPTGVGEVA